MRYLLLTFVAIATPTALLAQCPTDADLAGGIVFTGPAGEREVFTQLEDGMVNASYQFPNGLKTEARLAKGAFLVELHDLPGTAGETTTNYVFPMDIKEIQPPTPGEIWDVTVSVTDGQHNAFDRQIYAYGETEAHSYGGCTYDVIPFTVEYSTLPEVVETYHFLPQLGLSYLYAYEDPTGVNRYPYTSIETVR